MRVLSLFDGMSCGQIALRDMGIIPEVYYASEIDNHAIQQTQINFPNTIQLGDARDIDVSKLGRIDLIIGGSPCQSLSFMGRITGMTTQHKTEVHTLQRYLALKEQGIEFEGESYLFWEFVRILKDVQAVNPDVKFLLENVNMKIKWERTINRAIGGVGIHINSSLLSAQNRHRIYWTNIHPTLPVPEDNGTNVSDILEFSVNEQYYLNDESTKQLLSNYDRALDDKICEKDGVGYSLVYPYRTKGGGLKSPTSPNKAGCIAATYYRGYDSYGTRAFILEYPTNIPDNEIAKNGRLRRLTPTECARLQTIPEWYEWRCSDSQQYTMVGNGWTVEVIKYIFSFLKQNNMKNLNQQETPNNAENSEDLGENKLVWVAEDPTDKRKGYVGKVMKSGVDKTVLTNYSDPSQLRVVHTSQTHEVCFAPIDEKNLMSDWINETLLEDCTQRDNKYLGWIENEPIYIEVLHDGRLYLRHATGTNIPKVTQDILEELMATEDILFTVNKIENVGCDNYWIVSFFFSL